jgi:NAD(P)-dependent dehydrogenase (short-subunit alcohol dehydrogenase family)
MSEAPPLGVVTGASRGIGRATALAFAERGLRLVLVARGTEENAETARLCLARGAAAVREVSADLRELGAVEHVAAEILAREGAPELVVHNAGSVHRARIEEFELEEWQRELALNLSAPFALTRGLLAAMRRRGRGRILFVGSISSTLGTPRQSAYSASKWGLVGLMKSLAEELSDSGLMTAAVLPGSVDTRMLEGSAFAARMRPEDVAKTLAYLAFDAPLAHNGGVVEMFGT